MNATRLSANRTERSSTDDLPWDRVRLSVVIPVYNEVGDGRDACYAGCARSRCGSRSSSWTTAPPTGRATSCPALEGTLIDRLVFHEQNRGKGAALRTGFAASHGRRRRRPGRRPGVRPRANSRSCCEPILAGKADAVYGSRFLGGPHRVLLLLALGRQPVPHAPVQHVHRPEPDRHGDLLQDGPAGAAAVASALGEPLRHRARTDRAAGPGRGADLRACRSATTAARTPRERRSAGRTVCRRCGPFSGTTSSDRRRPDGPRPKSPSGTRRSACRRSPSIGAGPVGRAERSPGPSPDRRPQRSSSGSHFWRTRALSAMGSRSTTTGSSSRTRW